MYNNVEKAEDGYYRYINMPVFEQLEDLYKNEYFVKEHEEVDKEKLHGNYKINYSESEMIYIKNELEKIDLVKNKYSKLENKYCLDIGCGEGFALNFFYKKGYNVVGLDFNNYACSYYNKEVADKVIVGNFYSTLDNLIKEGKKFDLIICNHVLEHVLYPVELINKASQLLEVNGILMVKVPNDFSILQKYLWDKKYISETFWVAAPEHINYFSLESLINIGNKIGIKTVEYYSDFPIDINLLNENTNYINDKGIGNSCANARNELENLICEISLEKTINLMKSFAELGLGRNIYIYYKKQ